MMIFEIVRRTELWKKKSLLNLLAVFVSLKELCAVICPLRRPKCLLTACLPPFSVAEGNFAGPQC